mgnify:CR=1 FL=1
MDAFRELIPVLCGLPASSKPKTDEEIHKMAFDEWLNVLRSLWIAIGKPVDNDRLMIYARVFEEVPYGLLVKAIKRVQLTTTYQVVPTIAEIHKAIQVELREVNCIDYDDWS